MPNLFQRWKRRDGVGARLTALVLACVTPLCVLAGLMLHDAYQQKRALIERHMAETAGAMVLSLVDGALGDVQAGLSVLALSSFLQTGDMARFYAQAREAAKIFPGADIILADETGQQHVNTYRNFGDKLPKRNAPDLVRRVFETGKPVVSDVFLGALTKRVVMAVDVPVRVDGAVKYDLSMTFPADRLGAALERLAMPDGWSGLVLDSKGAVVAKIGAYEGPVGQPGPVDLTGAVEDEPWRTADVGGRAVTAAFAASNEVNWRALVFAPADVVDGALRDWLKWSVGLAAGLLALAVGLALRVATGIARSIRGLEAPALALGRGETPAFTPGGLKETAAVARAIRQAAELLAERGAERDHAEAALLERSRLLQRRHQGVRILNDVAASPEADLDKLLTAALSAGVAHLGMKIGVISRIEGRSVIIRRHIAPPELGLEDGARFDLAETYCAFAADADGVTAEAHVGRSCYADRPGYAKFKLESYIGAPLRVAGRTIGAVSFAAADPAPQPFDEGDQEFVLLLARWIGAMLERDSAAAELARSNAELDQFAYIASHDLREPLRQVSTYATLLERRLEGALDAEASSYFAVVRDGAKRMNRLILDMLDYSMIGRHERPLAPVALSRAVADAAHRLAGEVRAGGARVLGGDSLPVVGGDYVEIVRLFTYLLDNAMKYADPDRPPVIELSAQRRGDGRVAVTVADNGVGVESDHFERIFLIFQRLNPRETGEGAGIGLAGAKKIVERHGGRIWLESTPGVGSRFHFTLPPAPDAGAEQA